MTDKEISAEEKAKAEWPVDTVIQYLKNFGSIQAKRLRDYDSHIEKAGEW